jgi:hypothetical protein
VIIVLINLNVINVISFISHKAFVVMLKCTKSLHGCDMAYAVKELIRIKSCNKLS